ncbi:hypothetical protein E2C01_083475 [Portunus trituberculatus]|uniref:Uncharacterized protein n=1 Tax=Portunus trituberculatus TaxID=210409 RepID=A0A5B7J1C3_PORTR|nr:hypothetical protein [Portunus trituberculatus]
MQRKYKRSQVRNVKEWVKQTGIQSRYLYRYLAQHLFVKDQDNILLHHSSVHTTKHPPHHPPRQPTSTAGFSRWSPVIRTRPTINLESVS